MSKDAGSSPRPKTVLKIALWFFVIGVLLAVLLDIVWYVAGYGPTGYAIEQTARVLWPSCIFLMALDGPNVGLAEVILVTSISIVANGVIYGLLGALVGVFRILFTSREEL
jgi:hypothetical protein